MNSLFFKMNKIILILWAICARAEANDIDSIGDGDINYRISNYINSNRLQNNQTIQEYDTKLELFRKNYLGIVDTLQLQLTMTVKGIVDNEEFLDPLELLGDLRKHCVTKHRSTLLDAIDAKTVIEQCILQASNQTDNLLKSAIDTRNKLKDYYEIDFETDIANCEQNYHNIIQNYTLCVTDAASNAIDVSVNNQKEFETQLDAAECTAKINIKSAFECTYSLQTKARTLISEKNLLIKNCINGNDKCLPCDEFHSCEERVLLDAVSDAFENPLANRMATTNCLLLERKH